jgi:hypothetical protein
MPRVRANLVFAFATAACGPYRGTQVYEVPQAYVGWVQIKYGDSKCAALPVEEGLAIRRIPTSGALCTSTPLHEGWGPNHYYEVGTSRVAIPTSGAPTDRRIWSPLSGEMASAAGTHRTEVFFVGTWTQHEARMNELERMQREEMERSLGDLAPDNNQMQRTRPATQGGQAGTRHEAVS